MKLVVNLGDYESDAENWKLLSEQALHRQHFDESEHGVILAELLFTMKWPPIAGP